MATYTNTRFLPRKATGFASIWLQAHLHIWAFLVAVAICGSVFGGIVAGQLNSSDTLVLGDAVQHLLQAISQHQLATSGDLWWKRVISDAQLFALIWLFGVSVIGLPFVVVVIFLRAFSAGFAIGFTVIQFGWKGFLLAGVAICLHQLISMGVFVVAGGIAIRFSAGIVRQMYPLKTLAIRFIQYSSLFALCAVVLMLGAAIQAYLAPGILTGLLSGAK